MWCNADNVHAPETEGKSPCIAPTSRAPLWTRWGPGKCICNPPPLSKELWGWSLVARASVYCFFFFYFAEIKCKAAGATPAALMGPGLVQQGQLYCLISGPAHQGKNAKNCALQEEVLLLFSGLFLLSSPLCSVQCPLVSSAVPGSS